MRTPYEPKKLPVEKDLDGMSLKSVTEHNKLYEGYVKKTNEIQEKLKTADKASANGVYSEFGELKRQETFAVNGMKLHEFYFALLGGTGECTGTIKGMIEKDFGSFDAWKEDFIATGMSSRGWAVLCFDWSDMHLHNYGSDAQNVGAVWNCSPLVAMDVYEHAYFMDHGTARKTYIEAFLKGLNWEFANKLVETYGLDKAQA